MRSQLRGRNSSILGSNRLDRNRSVQKDYRLAGVLSVFSNPFLCRRPPFRPPSLQSSRIHALPIPLPSQLRDLPTLLRLSTRYPRQPPPHALALLPQLPPQPPSGLSGTMDFDYSPSLPL